MSLTPGTRLGPYEITAPIGAGGMGEVYKARDTRLDRLVAVKILPDSLAEDPQFRERFDREARAISQLEHAHICPLYDVGTERGIAFLVMQYLEGETLAERLTRAASQKAPGLPLDEALTVAIQIASALEAAHRAGIVHRDLKPGNIMLTRTGAKLLDFGLAKASAPIVAGSSLSMLPTTPPADWGRGGALTAQGAILGTFQYMAPEQLEGAEADQRTDIFSFGAVVYEMLTGRKAFEGRSQASLISSIMTAQPAPVASVQPRATSSLDRVVRTCLAKNPDERWQSAADLTRELKWIAERGATEEPAATPAATGRRAARLWIPWSIAALATIAAMLFAFLYFTQPAAPRAVARFSVVPPKDVVVDPRAAVQAISPDGQRLAFVGASTSGTLQLWVRPIDALDAQPLPGTEGAGGPFWSPDSRSLGFFAQGKLKKIDVSGGPALTLANTPSPAGGAWGADGTIVFATNTTGPLLRVSAAGGEAVPVTTIDRTRKEVSHRFPEFLPDGKHFLYLAQAPNTVYVGSVDNAPAKRLFNADSAAKYSPAGYLLFMRQGTLMAQPFDAARLEPTGDAFVVIEQVQVNAGTGAATFSVSSNGILTYRAGGGFRTQMSWFDRSGKPQGTVGPIGDFEGLDLSPDGERVVAHRHDGQGGNLWLIEWKRDIVSRFTFVDAAHDVSPIWSSDGGRVAFASSNAGPNNLFQKVSTGAGIDEPLLKSDEQKRPTHWSSDGKFIVYEQGNAPSRDILLLPTSGERKPIPFLNQPFDEARGQLSPDGRWMAYTSNESGSYQVYVQPSPATGAKWQISNNGGSHPRWRSNGKELFYVTADGSLMATEANGSGATLIRGNPALLFKIRLTAASGLAGLWHPYSVSADGQRILAIVNLDDPTASPLTVVMDWVAAARR